MNMQTNPSPIGHNQPPPITEVLSENQAALLGEVEALARLAGSAPNEVKSELDLDTVGKIVRAAADLAKRADGARVAEKDPYLVGGREVDAFFKAPLDRLDRIKKVMTDRASIYQRKVADAAREKAAAEAKRLRDEEAAAKTADMAKEASQAAKAAEQTAAAPVADLTRTVTQSGILAGAKSSWVFEVTDWTAIPLEKLRPYLKHEAIEAAIRAAVKIGERDLAGVRIFEQATATFKK
jgi:hypothetical protein